MLSKTSHIASNLSRSLPFARNAARVGAIKSQLRFKSDFRDPGFTKGRKGSIVLQEKDATELSEDQKKGWVEVLDNESGKTYWWHVPTGITTAVGEARPGDIGDFRNSMVSSFLWGGALAVGVGLLFRLFG